MFLRPGLRVRSFVRKAAAVALACVSVGWVVVDGSQIAPGLDEAPLAPKSGPPGKTMFTLMSSAQTGIVTENPYNDPKMWGEHYREFALGSMGTGIAIGDYDNDGKPDVFVVTKTGQCRLFRNLGNWKFEDVTEKAGLMEDSGGWLDRAKTLIGESPSTADVEHWKQGATWVDVNNDGWLDLYVCRFNAPNLLYINQHDGTFKEEAAKRGLAVVDASVVGAFCDYDRDGWPDVYLQTNMLDAARRPNGQPDYVFHNNGDGTFTDVTARAGISGDTMAHSTIWWDYNGDGWPDIYVTNDFSGPDALYRNNGDGTFTNVIGEVVPHMPDSAMGADLGDVNNDGRVDLMVADMASSTHEKDQRGMAITRELARDDDGSSGPPQYARNALYINTGTGRVQEAAYLAGFPGTDWTWSVRFEDLDNDGRLDLHITNGMFREYQNADLRQRVMLAERLEERIQIMRASQVERDRHFAFRNLGDLKFEDVSAAWGLDQAGPSFGTAFGDLDGDGDLDVIFSNYEGGVTVLRNDCQTGHRLIVALRGTKSNRFGLGATVRIETASGIQVRQMLAVRGYLSTSEPVAHFGLGNDTLIKRLTVAWPSGVVQTFANLAVDRRFTLTEPATNARPSPANPPRPPGQFEDVSRTYGLDLPTRENFNEELNPQPLLPERFNHRGPALASGDLDRNGRQDFVLAGTSMDPIRVLRRLANGTFTPGQDISALTGSTIEPDGPLLVFDADGDGNDDLLVTKAGTALAAGAPDYQPRLLLNDGRGGWRAAADGALPDLPISVGAVAAADFNRDGKLDVFLGGRVQPGEYPLPARSALLVNRGGRFEDVTDALAPGLRNVGMVSSALWSDVDGDGWPDLLLALEWGEVKYFHNDQGRGFSDWTEKAGFASAGTGWWTSIASADFNGDGRPDYVVGNLGLNTQYHASPGHPALLYYGDFAGTGSPLIVEAYYEGEQLFPWRTRNDLAAKIPSVKQRYRRNDLYARSTLPEILGADRLQTARRFAATELRSGVLLSQPNGTYRFAPLPRIAQIAPFQGLVAGDFDGDGHADIYAVQNSYAPIPSIGHFDGGLSQFLRGDGRGHFEPVGPAESGLVVPGDAKALVVTDLDGDGWPDFILTRNNATTLAFHNHGQPGRHEFCVELRGPTGNPTAVGAQVKCELADGTAESAEIAAGSGYYSQSPAACFFGYPDDNPPRRITVRWPDGRVSEQAAPFTALTMMAESN